MTPLSRAAAIIAIIRDLLIIAVLVSGILLAADVAYGYEKSHAATDPSVGQLVCDPSVSCHH